MTLSLQEELLIPHMPESNYNYDPPIPTSRLERLLRERELRRFPRSFRFNEDLRDNNGKVDTFGNGYYPSGGDKGVREDNLFEQIATSKSLNDGLERSDD
ncbi:unnamed protein product [Fraxinus pennsylvanica]|uniref:Uncharacterized protein n=1 Tax=Fraxinus pennsylvanica TaxID=56036 RepID=A0AAD2A910_9LAMI|nr:unnamed protein product [Fraxinus pennsylvanica]